MKYSYQLTLMAFFFWLNFLNKQVWFHMIGGSLLSNGLDNQVKPWRSPWENMPKCLVFQLLKSLSFQDESRGYILNCELWYWGVFITLYCPFRSLLMLFMASLSSLPLLFSLWVHWLRFISSVSSCYLLWQRLLSFSLQTAWAKQSQDPPAVVRNSIII